MNPYTYTLEGIGSRITIFWKGWLENIVYGRDNLWLACSGYCVVCGQRRRTPRVCRLFGHRIHHVWWSSAPIFSASHSRCRRLEWTPIVPLHSSVRISFGINCTRRFVVDAAAAQRCRTEEKKNSQTHSSLPLASRIDRIPGMHSSVCFTRGQKK